MIDLNELANAQVAQSMTRLSVAADHSTSLMNNSFTNLLVTPDAAEAAATSKLLYPGEPGKAAPAV